MIQQNLSLKARPLLVVVFLCFSAASASSSKSSSESTFHGSHEEYYYIRIPGPQVIGYFLEFVPGDNSEPFKPNLDETGNSPIIKAFQLYDQAPNLIKASDPNNSANALVDTSQN